MAVPFISFGILQEYIYTQKKNKKRNIMHIIIL